MILLRLDIQQETRQSINNSSSVTMNELQQIEK